MSDTTEKYIEEHIVLPVNAENKQKPKATFIHVLFLGLSMKLGGFVINWNYGFQGGFSPFLGATIGIGFAYTMLAFCMAEMVSIMSFSGGYYGYARCALGPLYGFLVGCSGAMESIFYLAMYVLKIGQFGMIFFDAPSHQQPFIWVFTYFILVLLHIFMGKYFWNTTFLLGVVSLSLIIIYILGSIPDLDYNKYATIASSTHEAAGNGQFLTVFRLAAVFFLGFDMITLTSNEVKDAKKTIPWALITLIGILFVLAIFIVIFVASQAPGITEELYQHSTYFPLVFGYEKIFDINRKQATFITVIPAFITALGYLHIVGRQIKSMSSSGLLPPVFKKTYGSEETPVYAMVLVATLAFLANLFAWAEDIYTTSSRISTMSGCFVYVSMFICFIVFRRRFSHLERSFHSPFGLFGAVSGLTVFAVMFILMILIKVRVYFKMTLLYFLYMFFMYIYYYSYAESRQCFSASEQKVFFKAYILNMQIKKKKAMHRRFSTSFCSCNWFSKRPARLTIYSDNSDNSRNGSNCDNSAGIRSTSANASTTMNSSTPTHLHSRRIVPINATASGEDISYLIPPSIVEEEEVLEQRIIFNGETIPEVETKQNNLDELAESELILDKIVSSLKSTRKGKDDDEEECQF